MTKDEFIYFSIYLFFSRKHVNFCDLTGQGRQGLARQSVSQALPYNNNSLLTLLADNITE